MTVRFRHLRRMAGVATAALAIAALSGCDMNERAPCEPQEHQVTTMTYLFRQAWWECPMGCVFNQYWYFRCGAETLEFVGFWDEDGGEEEPDWWEGASTAQSFFISARDCSIATWDSCSDISKTPREDREAEEAVLWLTGSLVASDSMYSRVLGDLASIRSQYGDSIPQVRSLSFRPPWIIGELVVRLTQEGNDRFLRGEYRDLDSLNSDFGVTEVKHILKSVLLLKFSRRLNPYRLADIYEQVESVLYANPDHFYGDYPNIYPWIEVEKR